MDRKKVKGRAKVRLKDKYKLTEIIFDPQFEINKKLSNSLKPLTEKKLNYILAEDAFRNLVH